MEKCAQSMLLVAVLLCAARIWKPGRTFTSFTWLSCVMTDGFFRRSVVRFSASSSSSSELRPLCMPINPSGLLTKTSRLKIASETTTTTRLDRIVLLFWCDLLLKPSGRHVGAWRPRTWCSVEAPSTPSSDALAARAAHAANALGHL